MLSKSLYIAICLSFTLSAVAQQQAQFTQFGHFKQYYNPGQAGSFEGGSITALHRSQWIGLEGAPSSQAITFNMPLLYGRVGVGGNLYRQSIGISESWTLDGAYAYRILMKDITFSLGLQASIRYWGVNYADSRLTATQGIADDEGIPTGMQSRFLPNFGVGLYLNNEYFYVGFSAPRIIEASVDFSEEVVNDIGRERRHYYAMAGVYIPLSDKFDLQPQALLKVAEQAPFDADMSLSLLMDKKHSIGMAYRLGGSSDQGFGEALAVMLGTHISDKLMLGMAYDFGLSALKDSHSGSWEAVLRYAFNPPQGDRVLNPRYF